MEIFDTTQLGLERALHGAAVRQSAIAENLANVNTPGYRRKDVDFHSVLADAFDAKTDRHEAVESIALEATVDQSAPVRWDGNGVDVDVEASAQAKTGLEYEALASIVKARNDILRSAMGVG
jgi:flagellar basal-body rod protein FlgB